VIIQSSCIITIFLVLTILYLGCKGWLFVPLRIQTDNHHKKYRFEAFLYPASEYHGGLAEFMPEGGGYASFLHGKVVDMLHFPLFEGKFPEWLPMWGGQHFEFFRPVFNLADTSITIGVLNIILFQRSFFAVDEPENKPSDITEDTNNTVDANNATAIAASGIKLSAEDVAATDSVITGVQPEGSNPESIDPHSPKE